MVENNRWCLTFSPKFIALDISGLKNSIVNKKWECYSTQVHDKSPPVWRVGPMPSILQAAIEPDERVKINLFTNWLYITTLSKIKAVKFVRK
jgi:hypothetical protein